MKQIVAFDFDGTLLDSRNRHIIVMRNVLDEFNIKLDVSDLIKFKSYGKNNVDYLISKGMDESTAKQIQKQWVQNIEQDKYLDVDILYDDAVDLLKKYYTDNDLILITARSNKPGTERQVDKFGIRKYFKDIFIVNPGKNATDLKSNVLKSQNVVLMIGDTNSDYMAAKNTGIGFVFHENGFHNKYTAIGDK